MEGSGASPAPHRATRPRCGGPERGGSGCGVHRRRGVVNARGPRLLACPLRHSPQSGLQPAVFAPFIKGGRRRAAAAGGFALYPDSTLRGSAKRTCFARKSLRRKVGVPVSPPLRSATPRRADFSPLYSPPLSKGADAAQRRRGDLRFTRTAGSADRPSAPASRARACVAKWVSLFLLDQPVHAEYRGTARRSPLRDTCRGHFFAGFSRLTCFRACGSLCAVPCFGV
jgi:hypothetical protein